MPSIRAGRPFRLGSRQHEQPHRNGYPELRDRDSAGCRVLEDSRSKEKPRQGPKGGVFDGRLPGRGDEPSVDRQSDTLKREMVCAPLPEIVVSRIWARCCVCITVSGLAFRIRIFPPCPVECAFSPSFPRLHQTLPAIARRQAAVGQELDSRDQARRYRLMARSGRSLLRCDDRLAIRLYCHFQVRATAAASARHGTASNTKNPPISVLTSTGDAHHGWAVHILSAN